MMIRWRMGNQCKNYLFWEMLSKHTLLSYPILSCQVSSCSILHCTAPSYLILPYLMLSYYVLLFLTTFAIISCLILSYRVMSCLILPYLPEFCYILLCSALPYWTSFTMISLLLFTILQCSVVSFHAYSWYFIELFVSNDSFDD